jgi:Pyruvate/2-oxoacid:ferredoxin oxidoreductase delta subunit
MRYVQGVNLQNCPIGGRLNFFLVGTQKNAKKTFHKTLISHGPSLDIGFFEQILRNERFMKCFFCVFLCPHQKKIQAAANRTILKIDALHISHFEAYVPLFSKHLWKLTIPQKLWVSALFEVG